MSRRILLIIAVVVSIITAVVLELQHKAVRYRDAAPVVAGLTLEVLETDVSRRSILPPATGAGNAAEFYVAAINSYAIRRIPVLRARGTKPIVEEPYPNEEELRNLEKGSDCARCDFLEQVDGRPRFQFAKPGTGAMWPITPVVDPIAERPYIGITRIFCMTVLKEARRRASKNDTSFDLLCTQVIQLGEHLRTNATCLLDEMLGIELQLMATRQREKLLAAAGDPIMTDRCTKYVQSLMRLSDAFREKYTRLDDPESAIAIVRGDKDRVWRIEALAAIRSMLYLRRLTIKQHELLKEALQISQFDSDPAFRDAAKHIAKLSAENYLGRGWVRADSTEHDAGS